MPDAASPTKIIVADRSLRVTRVNDSLDSGSESVARTDSEPNYGCLLDYLDDFERSEAENICATILAGGQFPGGARSLRKVITEPEVLGDRWVVYVGPQVGKEGQVDGVIYAKFHTSGSEEIPQRDLDPEKLYEYLVENSRDLVFLLSPEGAFTFVNRYLQEIRGIPASEFIGKHFSEMLHPDDIANTREAVDQAFATNVPGVIQYRTIRPDGSIHHITVNASLIKSENGDRLLCIGRDISEAVELRERLIARNSVLSALNTVVVALSSGSSLDELLQPVLEKILCALGLSVGSISLVEAGGLHVRAAAGFAGRDVDLVGSTCPFAALCAELAEVIVVPDMVNDLRFDAEARQLAANLGLEACVQIPLISGGSVFAVLSLIVPPPADLTLEQMEFTKLAAGILGPAIENARLHSDLAERANQLAMLNRLAKSINTGRDIQGVLAACFQEIAGLVNFDRASLMFMEENGYCEVFRYWRDETAEPVQKIHLTAEHMAILGAARGPRVINDLLAAPEIQGCHSVIPAYGSAIIIPLSNGEASRGLLKVWHRESGRFGQRELRIMEAAAEHLSIAASNARLHEAERAKSLELEALAREAHHRIKNNLQMITGLLSISSNDQNLNGRATSRCLRQVRAIASVHDLLTPKSKAMKLNLKGCLTKVAEHALKATGCGDRIRLTVDGDDRLVSTDEATALSIIVNEFVCNSVEHAFGESGTGSIQTVISNSGGKTVVRIGDDGAGLPDGFVMPQSPDSGLGLATSLAAHGLGGKVKLESTGQGTWASVMF